MLFSERHGYTPVKQAIQIESMDDDLRISLWNVLMTVVWEDTRVGVVADLGRLLWTDVLSETVDDLPYSVNDIRDDLKEFYFEEAEWHGIYSILEFIVQNVPNDIKQHLIHECNNVLKKEISAYRFVGCQIAPMTCESEIAVVEKTLSNSTLCDGARRHIEIALKMLSDRLNPDFRNSIKESISAVESVAQSITGDLSASLGKALDAIEQKTDMKLHGALKSGYDKIYGYTSDADGIRHAMMEESKLDFEDAYYMLVSCSAFVNYLVAKAQKAGIDLK